MQATQMHQYIVFRAGHGQFIVNAASVVQAVQEVILHNEGTASDWVCHDLSNYNPKMRQRLLETSETI